ncbi:SDR family oxidoreductase [Priestia aryabhattai]|uniref:SDR family NAD(P)-dependent oxidoreductase n=1 Tax=Priestia aryabhattai TaxID=412384 RepID=UPI00209B5C27|nr:SDR family NAD(P)-dependent oxidoreductase [Priestia aryabhattai]WDL86271.1 SDR family oxidoreductase [Priestia aryabhattai]
MNTKELRNIHALVTGASSGLGFSMAEALLQGGATVALASRGGTKLDQAVEKLKRQGYPAVGIPLDVRSEQSVKKTKEQTFSPACLESRSIEEIHQKRELYSTRANR